MGTSQQQYNGRATAGGVKGAYTPWFDCSRQLLHAYTGLASWSDALRVCLSVSGRFGTNTQAAPIPCPSRAILWTCHEHCGQHHCWLQLCCLLLLTHAAAFSQGPCTPFPRALLHFRLEDQLLLLDQTLLSRYVACCGGKEVVGQLCHMLHISATVAVACLPGTCEHGRMQCNISVRYSNTK